MLERNLVTQGYDLTGELPQNDAAAGGSIFLSPKINWELMIIFRIKQGDAVVFTPCKSSNILPANCNMVAQGSDQHEHFFLYFSLGALGLKGMKQKLDAFKIPINHH